MMQSWPVHLADERKKGSQEAVQERPRGRWRESKSRGGLQDTGWSC